MYIHKILQWCVFLIYNNNNNILAYLFTNPSNLHSIKKKKKLSSCILTYFSSSPAFGDGLTLLWCMPGGWFFFGLTDSLCLAAEFSSRLELSHIFKFGSIFWRLKNVYCNIIYLCLKRIYKCFIFIDKMLQLFICCYYYDIYNVLIKSNLAIL